MDKGIDAYIEKQESPQKEILKSLRKLIHRTLPGCTEKMAWGVPVFQDGKLYIVGLKDHVNIGFSINGLDKEEVNLLEGSGKTMRHIKIKTPNNIDEKLLKKLILLVDRKAKCVKC